MFALSRNTSVSADGFQNDAAPRAVIRIAFPSFRTGHGKSKKQISKPQPTSREELQSLFGDDLRSSVKPK